MSAGARADFRNSESAQALAKIGDGTPGAPQLYGAAPPEAIDPDNQAGSFVPEIRDGLKNKPVFAPFPTKSPENVPKIICFDSGECRNLASRFFQGVP